MLKSRLFRAAAAFSLVAAASVLFSSEAQAQSCGYRGGGFGGYRGGSGVSISFGSGYGRGVSFSAGSFQPVYRRPVYYAPRHVHYVPVRRTRCNDYRYYPVHPSSRYHY